MRLTPHAAQLLFRNSRSTDLCDAATQDRPLRLQDAVNVSPTPDATFTALVRPFWRKHVRSDIVTRGVSHTSLSLCVQIPPVHALFPRKHTLQPIGPNQRVYKRYFCVCLPTEAHSAPALFQVSSSSCAHGLIAFPAPGPAPTSGRSSQISLSRSFRKQQAPSLAPSFGGRSSLCTCTHQGHAAVFIVFARQPLLPGCSTVASTTAARASRAQRHAASLLAATALIRS